MRLFEWIRVCTDDIGKIVNKLELAASGTRRVLAFDLAHGLSPFPEKV
jgi:hypothetical protein